MKHELDEEKVGTVPAAAETRKINMLPANELSSKSPISDDVEDKYNCTKCGSID